MLKVSDVKTGVQLVEPGAIIGLGVEKGDFFHSGTLTFFLVVCDFYGMLYLQVQLRQYFCPVEFHTGDKGEIIAEKHEIERANEDIRSVFAEFP